MVGDELTKSPPAAVQHRHRTGKDCGWQLLKFDWFDIPQYLERIGTITVTECITMNTSIDRNVVQISEE